MSGQWEVVGKKKDRSSSKLPIAKTINKQDNKKKSALNGVNIEEVLPMSQVQNLYAANRNKENKKPHEKPKATTTDNNSNKKPQKKIEKPQDPPKSKPPKSIESALNSIDVDEFQSVYEKIRNQYPDGQIIWLRELAQYLNKKIPIEVQDPVFSTRPAGYPFNVVPPALRNVIEKSVKDGGTDMTSVFFGISLTSMATDMSKGLSSVGYKIYLQCIALNDTTLFADGVSSNMITLLNSYQNRPNIGLSILWAVGHAGIKNINTGLKVFKEFMLPLLEMKNYSRYVMKYLLDLLKGLNEKSFFSKDDFLLILDTVYSNKKNVPGGDLRRDLENIVPTLKTFLFKNNNESCKGYFNVLFKKLIVNTNESYQNCLCEVICDIFKREQSTLNLWIGVYKNNLIASAILLNYLSDNANVINKINRKAFDELIKNFESINDMLLIKKKKDEGLLDCITAIKVHLRLSF